jgi:hypothetical protein
MGAYHRQEGVSSSEKLMDKSRRVAYVEDKLYVDAKKSISDELAKRLKSSAMSLMIHIYDPVMSLGTSPINAKVRRESFAVQTGLIQ